MNGWITSPIGRVASIQGGYSFKSKDWQSSGVPVVKIANVKNGYLDLSDCSYVSAAIAEEAKEFFLREGDVLIGMTGYVGTVARVALSNLPALLNQRVGRFRFLPGASVHPAYFYRAIRLPEIKDQFENLSGGSAQPNLSGKQIESVEIPLPRIEDQRKLATLLESLDDSVSLCRARIATLDGVGETALRWFLAELAERGPNR